MNVRYNLDELIGRAQPVRGGSVATEYSPQFNNGRQNVDYRRPTLVGSGNGSEKHYHEAEDQSRNEILHNQDADLLHRRNLERERDEKEQMREEREAEIEDPDDLDLDAILRELLEGSIE